MAYWLIKLWWKWIWKICLSLVITSYTGRISLGVFWKVTSLNGSKLLWKFELLSTATNSIAVPRQVSQHCFLWRRRKGAPVKCIKLSSAASLFALSLGTQQTSFPTDPAVFVYFFCLWIKITSGYFLAKCIFIGIIYHLLLHFGKNGLPVCKTVPDRPAASSSLTWWQLSTSTLKYSCLFFMRAQNRNITHLLNSDIQIQRAVLGNTLFLHGSTHFHLFI